jgi:hypothetical protein
MDFLSYHTTADECLFNHLSSECDVQIDTQKVVVFQAIAAAKANSKAVKSDTGFIRSKANTDLYNEFAQKSTIISDLKGLIDLISSFRSQNYNEIQKYFRANCFEVVEKGDGLGPRPLLKLANMTKSIEALISKIASKLGNLLRHLSKSSLDIGQLQLLGVEDIQTHFEKAKECAKTVHYYVTCRVESTEEVRYANLEAQYQYQLGISNLIKCENLINTLKDKLTRKEAELAQRAAELATASKPIISAKNPIKDSNDVAQTTTAGSASTKIVAGPSQGPLDEHHKSDALVVRPGLGLEGDTKRAFDPSAMGASGGSAGKLTIKPSPYVGGAFTPQYGNKQTSAGSGGDPSLKQLEELYANLNQKQQKVLFKLLDSSSKKSCDVTLSEFVNLIQGAKIPGSLEFAGGLGGKVYRVGNTGSHFRIDLPNTTKVWQKHSDSGRKVFSYVDIPTASSGGFRPKVGAKSKLPDAARMLCQKALEKAGITKESLMKIFAVNMPNNSVTKPKN